MDQPIYETKNEGKTLFSLLFLIVAIATVVLGSNLGAPIYLYVPTGFALLFCAWWFMNNPNHGCKLNGETIELWSNKNRQTISVSNIALVEVKEGMDGPDVVNLVMNDGTKTRVSHLQIGDVIEFGNALETVGLRLIKSD